MTASNPFRGRTPMWRSAAAGVLAGAAALAVAGAAQADPPPGCPHLTGTAGRYVDNTKLCAAMQREVQNWLAGNNIDVGRAVRDSWRGQASQPAPEQPQQVVRLPQAQQQPTTAPAAAPSPMATKSPEKPEAAPVSREAEEHHVRNRPRRDHRRMPDHPAASPAATATGEKPQAIEEAAARRGLGHRPTAINPRTPSAKPLTRPKRSLAPRPTLTEKHEPAPYAANAALESSASTMPLTIPVGLAALLVLAIAYHRRRQCVGAAVMWWRRTRLTRQGDRLVRYSEVRDTLPFPPVEASEESVTLVRADDDVPVTTLGSMLEQESTSLGYLVALSAMNGAGLTGPGAENVTRAMVLELLAGRHMAARVLVPREDAVRLFGEEALHAANPGLVMLDTLQEVVTELEVEIVRRSGQRTDAGVPEGQSWLFVIASPGAAAERLHRIVQGGTEDLILGVFLGDWPYGITCTVDESGIILNLEGRSAPAWTAHRLAICSQSDAVRHLAGCD
ncbi:hypothetical protein AB0B54_36305 [Microbispora bryophytorum]|uniref:hypothetical protein n=1 Tax=Microbispora bryophytorum TaxID=1460882 RepID=UPI0033CC3C22